MNTTQLKSLIVACQKNKSKAQRKLFQQMYQFAMSIATRYGQNREETEEIANNALYKMLAKIDQYKEHTPFTLWVRRIVINCGIDYYRKYHKNQSREIDIQAHSRNLGENKLETEYLLQMIRRLSPKYRMVFNLFVMEGYSHEEIAKEMEISIGTSKSNLSKARHKLQGWVLAHQDQMEKYGK
ncbi:RNA polymerase sigma factor [Saprospiraceae bacterium]|nr:RNA polymerase sigma factor [Saprospiraceae bacterium]